MASHAIPMTRRRAHRAGHSKVAHTNAIDRMSAKEAKRLIDKVIVLREDVGRAYYKRSFSR